MAYCGLFFLIWRFRVSIMRQLIGMGKFILDKFRFDPREDSRIGGRPASTRATAMMGNRRRRSSYSYSATGGVPSITRLAVSLAILLAVGGIGSFAQQFYVTQPGDNLFRIALRSGTTIEALAAANDIPHPYTIHSGTRIRLAGPSASAQRIYIVQPGDNLYLIALKHGTTAEALAAANGVGPPYTVHAGARLVVANPNDLPEHNYIVRPGDSLSSIARRKGITVEALAIANGIGPPFTIHVGNWLTVPAPWCPEDGAMSPAAPEDDGGGGDPNLCNGAWTDCGDGSTPESECRWKVGWCVANLGHDVEQCLAKFCNEMSDEPEPRPPQMTEPEPMCVFIERFDNNGNSIPWDVIDTVCIKACQAGDPPIDECTSRGY